MKSVVQILDTANGMRSEAMTIEKCSFADFLKKQDLSDRYLDQHVVMIIVDNLDNENGVVCREPFMPVRQFIYVYGSKADG